MSLDPRGPNFESVLYLKDTVSTLAAPASGIPLSGIEAAAVAIVDASGTQITSFGSTTADQSTFVASTTTGGISMGVFQTSPDTIANNKAAAIAIDTNRNTKVVGTKTNNNAAPGANNVGVLPALANAANPTFTEGDQVTSSVDLVGATRIVNAYLTEGENTTTHRLNNEPVYSFLNVAAGQATTTVKSGAGTLHSIVFNSAATTTNTTTIYDNTAASGTVIAIPAATTATVPTTLLFDISFATGLTVITATANGSNMTFCYR